MTELYKIRHQAQNQTMKRQKLEQKYYRLRRSGEHDKAEKVMAKLVEMDVKALH